MTCHEKIKTGFEDGETSLGYVTPAMRAKEYKVYHSIQHTRTGTIPT